MIQVSGAMVIVLSYPDGGGYSPGCLAGWGQRRGSATIALQSLKQTFGKEGHVTVSLD